LDEHPSFPFVLPFQSHLFTVLIAAKGWVIGVEDAPLGASFEELYANVFCIDEKCKKCWGGKARWRWIERAFVESN